MMLKKCCILVIILLAGRTAFAQNTPPDTTLQPFDKSLLIDTSYDYDELFKDLDAFLDSILAPRSYWLGSVSFSNGYYNFGNSSLEQVQTSKKLTFSPTVGYYDKSGVGFTVTGYGVHDGSNLNLYQYSLTPSFDYLRNKRLATGISYSRYITRDSLSFYTSPLKNELYAYFTYRKWWLKPTVAVSYGWGSRSDYQQQEALITSLRLRPRGFTYINTTESVSDFSVLAILRHDFYWLDVLGKDDHIRLTPQLSFASGTQKFGFNQTSSTYATTIRTGNNVLFSSENVYLDNATKFMPQSLTFYLRGEYALKKFFVQPQFALDYYFPATSKNLTGIFSVNVGVMF